MANETDKTGPESGDVAATPESESSDSSALATPVTPPAEASTASDAEPSASDPPATAEAPAAAAPAAAAPAAAAPDPPATAEAPAAAAPAAADEAAAAPPAAEVAAAVPAEGEEGAAEGEEGAAEGEKDGKTPLTRAQKARRGVLLLLLLLAVTFLVLKFLVGFEGGGGDSAPNLVAVGPAAPVGGKLSIEVTEPLELDQMKRQELIALRAEAATRYPRLLVGDYSPNDDVFSGLTDGLSWWGLDGWRIHGPGEMAGEGVSRDSLLLMNPYILVGLEVSFTRWGEWQVTRDNFVEEDMATMDGCLGPKPTKLTWNPQDRTAEVVYGYRDYRKSFDAMLHVVARRSDLIRLPRFKTGIQFSAVNARDLGFNYMRVSVRESGRAELDEGQELAHDLPPAPWPIQIAALMDDAEAAGAAAAEAGGEPTGEAPKKEGEGGDKKAEAEKKAKEEAEKKAEAEEEEEVSKEPAATVLPVFKITDRFGATGECSIPEMGCQGVIGQSTDLVEGLDVLAIPAKVTFYLWREKPEGEVEPPPDMRFIVTLK